MSNAVTKVAVAVGALLIGGCSSMNTGGLSHSTSDWKDLFSTSKVTDYEDRLSRGIYAVAGIGPSRLEPDTTEVAGWNPNDRVEPAGQLTLGVDLTKHLSLEAHTADLGSAGLSPTGRINYHVDGVSALIYAGGNRDRYRRQGLNAYGRLGLGVLENTPVGDVPYLQTNDTHILIGAGVEYMTPIGVGLRAEGVAFDADVQYAQLGLMYRTGRKQQLQRPKLAAAPQPKPQPVVAAAAPPPPPPPLLTPALPVPSRCDGLEGVMGGVDFKTDSEVLTAKSVEILDEVAYIISTCEDVEVEIAAHTDSTGSESYNQALSERRARSVVNYLRSRGLNGSNLKASAYGETSPIDTNKTAEGRARNRRVELYAR